MIKKMLNTANENTALVHIKNILLISSYTPILKYMYMYP